MQNAGHPASAPMARRRIGVRRVSAKHIWGHARHGISPSSAVTPASARPRPGAGSGTALESLCENVGVASW